MIANNGADQIRLQTDKTADTELRHKMCKAELEAVLAKYGMGLVFKQVMINGQMVTGEWALTAVQKPIVAQAKPY